MSLAPSALVQLDSAYELFSRAARGFRATKVLVRDLSPSSFFGFLPIFSPPRKLCVIFENERTTVWMSSGVERPPLRWVDTPISPLMGPYLSKMDLRMTS